MNTYRGGGYVAELGITAYRARKRIQALKKYGWIDSHTKAVFLEMTVYNANINLFSYAITIIEFPQMGSVIKSLWMTTFQVMSMDDLYLSCAKTDCTLPMYSTQYTKETV